MSTPPSDYVCGICYGSGHWIQNCVSKSSKYIPAGYFCKICQTPGRFILNCPFKSDSTHKVSTQDQRKAYLDIAMHIVTIFTTSAHRS